MIQFFVPMRPKGKERARVVIQNLIDFIEEGRK